MKIVFEHGMPKKTHRTQGTNFTAKCLRILVNCQKLKKFDNCILSNGALEHSYRTLADILDIM